MRISDWSSDVCSSDLHCQRVVKRILVLGTFENGQPPDHAPVIENAHLRAKPCVENEGPYAARHKAGREQGLWRAPTMRRDQPTHDRNSDDRWQDEVSEVARRHRQRKDRTSGGKGKRV